MWEKARSAAGFPPTVVEKKAAVTASKKAPVLASKKVPVGAAKLAATQPKGARKRYAHKTHSPKRPVPAVPAQPMMRAQMN
jgi:hypothetical protein